MLTFHQWNPVTIKRRQFHKRYSAIKYQNYLEYYSSKIAFKSFRDLWVHNLLCSESIWHLASPHRNHATVILGELIGIVTKVCVGVSRDMGMAQLLNHLATASYNIPWWLFNTHTRGSNDLNTSELTPNKRPLSSRSREECRSEQLYYQWVSARKT